MCNYTRDPRLVKGKRGEWPGDGHQAMDTLDLSPGRDRDARPAGGSHAGARHQPQPVRAGPARDSQRQDDKFVVQEPTTQDRVWWGPVNRPFDPARFDALYGRLLDFRGGSLIENTRAAYPATFIQDASCTRGCTPTCWAKRSPAAACHAGW